MAIPELIFGTIAVLGGIVGVLLFMQTLTNLERESTKYLLLAEACSAIVLLLVGFNILSLINVENIKIVMISFGLLTIAIAFLIYDDRKIDYTATKA